jgi:hypothetical protein
MLELGFSAWGQEGTCQNLRWGPSMEDRLAIFSLVNQPAAMPSSYRLPIPIPRNKPMQMLTKLSGIRPGHSRQKTQRDRGCGNQRIHCERIHVANHCCLPTDLIGEFGHTDIGI